MPVPEGCGMIRFDTPLPVHSVEVHGRCVGRPACLSQALEGWYKGAQGSPLQSHTVS